MTVMTGALPRVQYDAIKMEGGLDQVTPTLSLPPGVAKESTNFEVSLFGGYSRIAGYERYDGHPSPSDQSFLVLQVGIYANTPIVGDALTGGTSAATGTVIVVNARTVILSKTTGSFAAGEALNRGATNIATISAVGDIITSKQTAIYLGAAADLYRVDIQPVPGDGPVRGVSVFDANVYAWRDNAGAMRMYKASAAGWVQVSLGYEVSFSNANTSVGEGDVLTQGGVTATINRVVVETGTLTSGTNTGRLIITAPAGGSFAAGAATSTGAGALTLSGAHSAITLLAGGHIETVTGNFTGSASTSRMYGCDGINRAFEFDGAVYVPLNHGTTSYYPKHIAIHRNHLFLSMYSSLMHSAIADPYNFTVIAGGAEIAVGDEITGLLNQPGSQTSDALAVYGKNNSYLIYGTSSTGANAWNVTTFNRGTGARHYTAQNLTSSYVLDDRGVTTLSQSQNYGNFDTAFLTFAIRPFVTENSSRAIASLVSREKSQYRVFFNNGLGLYLTIINGQYKGAMPVKFNHTPSCSASGENSSGKEILFFGSDSGYVYQLDRGSSFDGEIVKYSLALNYDATQSPRLRKRYRRCGLEVSGEGYAEINFSYLLGYNSLEIMQPNVDNYSGNFAQSNWDSMVWDQFVWDTSMLQPVECEMVGTAVNAALYFTGSSAYVKPFTINSAIIHYTYRRGVR